MSQQNYNILQEKIRDFVKKYYKNELYKGIIYFVLIVLSAFIAFTLFEYFSYSNTTVRSVLFYGFIALFLANLVFYIVIPLFKLFGLGKQLTNEEIATIIGKHFDQIDDKLLNLFELQKQMDAGDYKSFDLLSAAIDTKIESFKPYSFSQAVPVKKTLRFARWLVIPVILFLLLFSIKSEIFTESTKRIVHYQTVYEKPAPYSFEITNKKLEAFQHDDFTVSVKVNGSETPEDVYIKYQNRSFKCDKKSNTEFSYTFSNVQNNTDFQFITDEVESSLYTLSVLPKPVTLGFELHMHYPAYLNKPDEVIENVGSVTVPEGTGIQWVFFTKNSDNLIFIVNDKPQLLSSENEKYSVYVNARNSFSYSIFNKNKYFTSKDTLSEEITVIKDMYPEIYVQSQQDSSYQDRIYFKGNIKDDYGFSVLHFVYTRYNADGKVVESTKKVSINIQNGSTIQDFYYFFDPTTFNLEPGEKIDYYFQVADNDGVNGHKTSKSNVSTFRVRTLEEINKDIQKAEQQSKSDYSNLIEESSELMKNIDKLQKQMLQEKELSWQDKKKLEQLMQQYQELQQQINELQQQQQNKEALENQYKDINEDILKKQQELKNRMDQVLSDEMKKMMDKMQELMKEMNKDQIQKQMQKMKTSTEDINQALDQQLQLYKQLEMEKKVTETVQQLRDLSEQLKQNAKQTENKNISKNLLQQQQQKIEDKYNQLKKDLQDIQTLNQQLEQPIQFKNTDEIKKDIDQQLQQSQQNLEKNNRSKSSQNQNKASEDMETLANQLERDFNEDELEQVSEDLETIRQILDNLVKISFDQEEILDKTKGLRAASPIVSELLSKQHKVKNDMRQIEDSLNALARRQMAVKPFIQKEVSKIQDYLETSQKYMNNRQFVQASKDEQFVLTSMNNLALMLKESMNEMQKKKSECKGKCNKSGGGGSCSKPGNNKKSKKTSARELQQQLNRQMQALKKSLEQQQQGQQQGQHGQQQQMSESFARMAAQQEAIRKMLEDYNNAQKSENGVGDKTIEQLIEEMKKTEKELVNRTITQQTIQRQEQITTRLLKSERADMEREKDEERKSNEAFQTPRLNPPKDWNMDKTKTQQDEMLRSVPANLNYYYKEKANNYFYNIE